MPSSKKVSSSVFIFCSPTSTAMAEAYPERRKDKQCPKCQRAYLTWKIVKDHLRGSEHHKSLSKAEKEEFVSSLPKDICTHCGDAKSDVMVHEKTCRSNPGRQESGSRGSTDGRKEKSNEAFLEAYSKRLREHVTNLASNTIQDYTALIGKMVAKEEAKAKAEATSFSAWQWLSPDSRYYKNPGIVGEYLTPGNTGKSTMKKFLAARKHLFEWARDRWFAAHEDPESQRTRAKNWDAKVNEAISRGAYDVSTHQGNEAEEEGQRKKSEPPRIDTAVTGQILQSWNKSPLRIRTLNEFASGNFKSKELGMDGNPDVAKRNGGVFLALQLFLNGRGIRSDVVRNLTIGALKNAERTVENCPYCQEKVQYEKHKDICVARQKSLKKGQNKDQNNGMRPPAQWTLKVEYHKTKQKAPICLIVNTQELKAIKNWVGQHLWNTASKNHCPFEEVGTWRQMRSTLKKLVRPELWKEVGDDAMRIGKMFRRYWVSVILKEGKEVENRLRAIGLSSQTAGKVYEDERTREVLRGGDAVWEDLVDCESDCEEEEEVGKSS